MYLEEAAVHRWLVRVKLVHALHLLLRWRVHHHARQQEDRSVHRVLFLLLLVHGEA